MTRVAGCLLLAVIVAGCGPGLRTSPQAKAWLALEKDPAEDGRDLDRWPAWRGRNGQGIAPGGDPPIRFSTSEAVRWKVDVSPGNSSPVVWQRQIFLTAQLDDAQPPTLGVLALDRRDGRVLWRTAAGRAKGPTHGKNGFASASIATDGRHLAAFFGAAGLFCFDTAGRELWHAELGPLKQKWGTASSPILYKDLVIQLCDGEIESSLSAFEVSSGRSAWRVPRTSKACWSTPVLVPAESEQGPRTELVVNGSSPADESQGWVIAYRPEDGRQLWQVPGTTHLVTPTLLVGGGLVFSTSGRNGPLMAIRPGSSRLPGGSSTSEGNRIVWQTRRGGPYIPSGLLYRNRLYVLADSGVFSCHNPGSGELIWQTRLPGPFTASLVAAAGRIYATSERGTVYVLSAGDTFQILAENPLRERALATPAIVGDDIFVRTERRLYCFSARTD